MAGTPEKILDYLLEGMRSDSTLSDPIGKFKDTRSEGLAHRRKMFKLLLDGN